MSMLFIKNNKILIKSSRVLGHFPIYVDIIFKKGSLIQKIKTESRAKIIYDTPLTISRFTVIIILKAGDKNDA